MEIKKPKIFWGLEERIASLGYKKMEDSKNYIRYERLEEDKQDLVSTIYGTEPRKYIKGVCFRYCKTKDGHGCFQIRVFDANPRTNCRAAELDAAEMRLFSRKLTRLNRKHGGLKT